VEKRSTQSPAEPADPLLFFSSLSSLPSTLASQCISPSILLFRNDFSATFPNLKTFHSAHRILFPSTFNIQMQNSHYVLFAQFALKSSYIRFTRNMRNCAFWSHLYCTALYRIYATSHNVEGNGCDLISNRTGNSGHFLFHSHLYTICFHALIILAAVSILCYTYTSVLINPLIKIQLIYLARININTRN